MRRVLNRFFEVVGRDVDLETMAMVVLAVLVLLELVAAGSHSLAAGLGLRQLAFPYHIHFSYA